MPTLFDVLEKKDVIFECGADFGYEDVEIYCDADSSALQLVLKVNPNVKHYSSAFHGWLTKQLDLNILITEKDFLKEPYKSTLLAKCASLTDIDAIEKFYRKKIADIKIENAPKDIGFLNHQVRTVALAEKILVSKKKPGVTISKIRFFTNSDLGKEEKLKRKAESLVKQVNNDITPVLATIPDETLTKLELQISEAKKLRACHHAPTITSKG